MDILNKISIYDIGIFGSYLIGFDIVNDVDFIIYGRDNLYKYYNNIDLIKKYCNCTDISDEHIEYQYNKFKNLYNHNCDIKTIISRNWSGIQVDKGILSTPRFILPERIIILIFFYFFISKKMLISNIHKITYYTYNIKEERSNIMGQYYNVYLRQGEKETVFNRYVENEYTGAKLMEHSWWYNDFVNSVCSIIYKKPSVIVWVGDYSDSCDEMDLDVYKKVWGESAKSVSILKNPLDLTNKYLVNHSKQWYVDLNKYKANNDYSGWIIHPLPLLVAVGNGQGGGDYYGINSYLVGDWAFDEISIEDVIPDNYNELEVSFKEK